MSMSVFGSRAEPSQAEQTFMLIRITSRAKPAHYPALTLILTENMTRIKRIFSPYLPKKIIFSATYSLSPGAPLISHFYSLRTTKGRLFNFYNQAPTDSVPIPSCTPWSMGMLKATSNGALGADLRRPTIPSRS
jgi:hypothetical protein